MWTMPPTMLFSPTAATAEVGSIPFFCRKRTLAAIPPTLAGETRLTNDDANCTWRSGPMGMCCGTVPTMPDALETYVRNDMTTMKRDPSPVGRLERFEAVAHLSELRQDEVERPCREGDHQQGPPTHPADRRELIRRSVGGRRRGSPRARQHLVAARQRPRRVEADSASGCNSGTADAIARGTDDRNSARRRRVPVRCGRPATRAARPRPAPPRGRWHSARRN